MQPPQKFQCLLLKSLNPFSAFIQAGKRYGVFRTRKDGTLDTRLSAERAHETFHQAQAQVRLLTDEGLYFTAVPLFLFTPSIHMN